MNNLLTDIELIDRYLKGSSNEYEGEIVRERLASDASFRHLFDDIELMIDGIKETAVQTTREEKLEHLHNFFNEAYNPSDESLEQTERDLGNEFIGSSSENYEEPTPGSGLGKGKVISFPAAEILGSYKVAIAAAVTLLIAAWFVVFQMNPVTNQQLFAENFIPFANLTSENRGETEVDDMKSAYAAYDQGNFEEAVALFEQGIQNSDNRILHTFYLGNAYLKLGNAEKAIEQFTIVESNGQGLTLESKWYLGLSYLLLDDTEKARVKFEEVSASSSEYAEEADTILNKLQ